jgi:hypothetical protein
MARRRKRVASHTLCEAPERTGDDDQDVPCKLRLGSLGERQGSKGTWAAPYTDPAGRTWYRCPVHGAVAIKDGARTYTLEI